MRLRIISSHVNTDVHTMHVTVDRVNKPGNVNDSSLCAEAAKRGT